MLSADIAEHPDAKASVAGFVGTLLWSIYDCVKSASAAINKLTCFYAMLWKTARTSIKLKPLMRALGLFL